MSENDNRSLTPEEVASILQIKRNTVYELVKRGELPAYRVGRKIRIDPRDVQIYKQQGKINEAGSLAPITIRPAPNMHMANEYRSDQGLVICGQDILLDILTRYLEMSTGANRVLRKNIGSFMGLSALYQDQAQMVGIHLWDGESGEYNVPYVRRLLPGIPAVIVHLGMRMQGFYVKAGNPKGIKDWADLVRNDIHFVNREKGSGTRVLLDETFRCLGLNRLDIQGYEREELSHLAVASAVARGEADVAMGSQKASMQVRGIEFIPLHQERYDLVMKKDDEGEAWFQAVIDIIQSRAFKDELQGLGDYDLSETGQITEI